MNPSPANRPTGPVEQNELMLLMGGVVHQDDINTADPNEAAMQDIDMDADEENLMEEEQPFDEDPFGYAGRGVDAP